MKYIVIFLFIFNSWALKNRALFSVNDEVYLTSDVNAYLSILQRGKCLKEDFSILNLLGNFKLKSVKVSKMSLSNKELQVVEDMMDLLKILRISGNSTGKFKSLAIISKCKLPKGSLMKINDLIKVRNFLQKNVITSKQSHSETVNTLNLFKKTLSSKVDIRAYY